MVATRPPDRTAELDQARRQLGFAADEHGFATLSFEHHDKARQRLGPLTRLRRGGRDDINRADQALAGAQRRLARVERASDDAAVAVVRLEVAVAESEAWDTAHAWRSARITEIDDTLAHHWADVVLRAARADDPLAFGLDRLRAARNVYAADLGHLLAGIPPDRRDALTAACANLRDREANLRASQQRAIETRAVVEEARRRRWGRRDPAPIQQADAARRTAERDLDRVAELVTKVRQNVAEERRAGQTRARAMNRSAAQRARLVAAIADLDTALASVGADRISVASLDRHPNRDIQPVPVRGEAAPPSP